MRLSQHVMQATHAWAAKGRKTSRQRQRRMMLAFAEVAEAQGARHPGQVGAKAAIAYWRAMRRAGKAYATQLDHWRALRELWRLWGKDAEPPKPSFFAKTGGKSDVPAPQSFPQFRGILPLPRIGEGGGDAKPVRHSLSWQVSPLESSHLAPVAVSQKSTKKRSLSDMVRDLPDRMPKKASA